MSKGTAATQGHRYIQYRTTGYLRFFIDYATTDLTYTMTSQALTVGEWHWCFVTFNTSAGTAAKAQFYIGKVDRPVLQATKSATEPAGAGTGDSSTGLYIGNTTANNNAAIGNIAIAAVWDRILTTEEMEWQRNNPATPVSPGACKVYMPLGSDSRLAAYDAEHNIVGTVTSATFQEAPPLNWTYSTPIDYATSIAAGGTAYNQSVSGAVTPSGAKIAQTGRSLAGVVSSSGARVMALSRSLAGAMSSSGAKVMALGRSLAGVVSSSGAKIAQTGRSLAGMMSSSGARVMQLSRSLAGVVSSSGSRVMALGRSLAGVVSSSGAKVMALGRSVAGVVTSSGAVSGLRVILMTLSGAVSSSGGISKTVGRGLDGAVTPGGVKTMALGRSLAGTVSSAGGILRGIARALGGVLSWLGSLTGSKSAAAGTVVDVTVLAWSATVAVESWSRDVTAPAWSRDVTAEV